MGGGDPRWRHAFVTQALCQLNGRRIHRGKPGIESLTHRQKSLRVSSMSPPVVFAHALADRTRWRIVHLIFDQGLCVCELADVLKLPQSTLSSHLRVIQKADLLDCERRGKWLFYRVKPEFHPLLRALFRHFEDAIRHDTTLSRDANKAETRLGKREQICCPSPQRLTRIASKHPSKTP
jgi:ArsR family transcriptional regulator